MRLSKSTTYAIQILIDCAYPNQDLAKVSDIANRLDITQQNTFKIVHLLSRTGYLEAVRGRYGGVRLAKPAEKIRIGQVVRDIESLVSVSSEPSNARGFDLLVDDALDAFIDVLDAHTLADMVANKRPPKRASKKTKRKTKSGRGKAIGRKAKAARSKNAPPGLRAS